MVTRRNSTLEFLRFGGHLRREEGNGNAVRTSRTGAGRPSFNSTGDVKPRGGLFETARVETEAGCHGSVPEGTVLGVGRTESNDASEHEGRYDIRSGLGEGRGCALHSGPGDEGVIDDQNSSTVGSCDGFEGVVVGFARVVDRGGPGPQQGGHHRFDGGESAERDFERMRAGPIFARRDGDDRVEVATVAATMHLRWSRRNRPMSPATWSTRLLRAEPARPSLYSRSRLCVRLGIS